MWTVISFHLFADNSIFVQGDFLVLLTPYLNSFLFFNYSQLYQLNWWIVVHRTMRETVHIHSPSWVVSFAGFGPEVRLLVHCGSVGLSCIRRSYSRFWGKGGWRGPDCMNRWCACKGELAKETLRGKGSSFSNHLELLMKSKNGFSFLWERGELSLRVQLFLLRNRTLKWL